MTDHPSSGMHVVSGQRSGMKSPFTGIAPSCEMAWHRSITWMRPACLWWTPTFQSNNEKSSSEGLRKGGRKCGLLMMTLSTKVVWISSIYYSPFFHHSTARLPSLHAPLPCLLGLLPIAPLPLCSMLSLPLLAPQRLLAEHSEVQNYPVCTNIGETDDSECTAAVGICQVDNPQKSGIS